MNAFAELQRRNRGDGSRKLRAGAVRLCLMTVAAAACVVWGVASAAQSGGAAPPTAHGQQEVSVDSLSVVKVRSRAVANARSANSLGQQREGTGVVIDSSGLVITIGYLIIEAENVELSTEIGRAHV